uniref:Uncharacterized protein n=1 Tax=Populus trichocarpa TaxID=3694 RepID=A0A2K2BKE2_POPTR
MHEVKEDEEIHIYIDVDTNVVLLTIKMHKCYTSKPNVTGVGKGETTTMESYVNHVRRNDGVSMVVEEGATIVNVGSSSEGACVGMSVDEWIDNLQEDACFGQTLDDALDLENEWELSSDGEDVDVKESENSDSSDENDDDENGSDGNKQKNKIIYPTNGFKCKTFKASANGSIKFTKCKIFTNITQFINVLREYKVKYKYHMKRYIN